jgi:hypothetical protein
VKRTIGVLIATIAAMAMLLPTTAFAAGQSAPCTATTTSDPNNTEQYILTFGDGTPAWSGVKANMNTMTLNRCDGSDPDNKSGVFVYLEVMDKASSIIDAPLLVDEGSTVAGHTHHDYMRIGYYLCSWAGDSSCNQGHNYFAAWGNSALGPCATDDAVGIRLIPGYPGAGVTVTFEIAYNQGEWKGYINGVSKINFSHPANYADEDPACWAEPGGSLPLNLASHAGTRVFDSGDEWAGDPTTKLKITSVRSRRSGSSYGIHDTSCFIPPHDNWRCEDLGMDSGNLWTQRPT